MSYLAIKVENLSKRYRIGLKEETKDTFVGAVGSVLKSPIQNLKRLQKLTHFNTNDQQHSAEKLFKLIGWKPSLPLEKGLKETTDWFSIKSNRIN